VPYALAPVALALIVYSLRHHGDEQLEPGLLVGSAVLLGLILLRQCLSILENRQLTAHVRRQLDFTGAMMRSLGEGVYALDMAGGITYMNPAAQRMLGWTQDELLGKNLHEIVHATVTGLGGGLCPLMAALQKGEAVQREEEILIRKDGSILPVAYSASPIESQGQQTGMVVVFQDITAARQVQEALRESEERYRGVVEASADAIVLLDLQGVITMANPGAAHLFRYTTPGEMLGVSCFDLISPHDHPQVRQHLRERVTMEKLVGRDTAYSFIRKDGSSFIGEVNSTVIFDDKGNPRSVAVVARDITDRRRAEEALRESEERYRELFENANDLVYTHDLQGNFTSINHAAVRVTGYRREDVLRLNIADVIAPEHLELAQQMIQHKAGSNQPMTYEVDIVTQDGSRVPVEVSTRLIWHGGRPVGMQGVARDITERRRAVAALAHQALHDALTGLPNRALLRDRLQQAILVAQRERSALALFFMDLDRFKEVNDTFGHHCGDALLQQLAVRLQRVLQESDTVARLGGDEFAILLPATGEAGAAAVARKLIAALEQPFEIEGHVFDVGASVGCALHPEHGADASTLMRKADVAMYIAKRTDCEYAIYSSDHDKNDPARLVLMRELRCALDEDAASYSSEPLPPHGRLLLHYQPQLNVKIGCTDHVEALVRWHHPERGLLFPGAFVPLAEETGLLEPLTRWVLTEALRQCSVWQQAGQDIRVAVNLSPRSLHDPQLVDTVATLLAKSSVKPSSLQVEITESAIIVNPERARETLACLHDMGVQVAIDDFGTGYSSLAYLKRLPIDDIKIDRSFVTNLTENSDNAFIVQSVIDLGHNLGLEVIAEGVENAPTYEYLARMGCDMIQGYYLSRPLPPADLACWYEALEDTRAAG
jgi:diguanylate cyclase (GGDEF)-like protein/PAS domain S-box-containing protein